MQSSPRYFVPLAFAVIKFCISIFAINPSYQLHRDEFLYLAEGRHLAWGFSEVPPLLPFLGRISFALGNSFFIVKFWPALFGALTAFLIGAMIVRFGGGWAAQAIAGLAYLFSAYLRIHILFQPNVLDIFFWSLCSYSLICFFQTQKSKWLYVAGISLGLGMLSKYMIAVFAIAVFAGLLLTRQRVIFRNRHFWFSLLLAFVIFLPNLLWQIQNQFPALQHAEELRDTQLQFISPFTFLIQQLLLTLNSFPVWLLGLLFLAQKSFERKFLFFVYAFIFLLLIFTFTGGKDYYTLGFYPVLLAAGAVWIEQKTMRWKWVRYASMAIIVLAGIAFVPVGLPYMSPQRAADFYQSHHMEKLGVLQWEDGRNHPLPQDYADMLGWKEMAEKTANIYHTLPDSVKNRTAIYCSNYGEAGALLYYDDHAAMPVPLSRSSTFELWFPKVIPASSLIVISDHNAPGSSERYEMKDVRLMDSISDPLAREYGTKIYFVGSLKYLGK